MGRLFKYASLIAIEYMPMAVTGMLVGAVATTNTLPSQEFIIGALSFLFVIAGFNSYNAIIDKKIDIINKPQRPLPTGELTEKTALSVAIISYIIALALAFFINTVFFALTIVTILLTLAYSHPKIYLKKRFLIGTITAVILYAVIAPLAGWALHPEYSIPSTLIFFLSVLGLPSGILKDYIDIVGDAYHNIRSMPIELGYYHSLLTVALFYVFSGGFLVYLVSQELLAPKYLLLLVFYPLMLLNLKNMPKKFNSHVRKDKIFINAMILFIALEIALVGLVLF